MTIELIVAMSNNYAIGNNNKLLWHIPEDLRRFKELTSGHSVLMGRNTWESLPEKYRPLPNRENFVLSSNKSFIANGAETLHSLDLIPLREKLFVIGGSEIYRQTIQYADIIHLTQVHIDVEEADTFFPKFDLTMWDISDNIVSSDENYKYSFLTLKRR